MDKGVPQSQWEGNDYRMQNAQTQRTSLTRMWKDSVYEFEKRRNVPVRYDRELVATTLKAMDRIQEIRQKRERAFWRNRYAFPPHLIPPLISSGCRGTSQRILERQLPTSSGISNSSNHADLLRRRWINERKPGRRSRSGRLGGRRWPCNNWVGTGRRRVG